MDRDRPSSDSPLRTLLVALSVALVCATLVSTTAVLLRPRQEANRERDRRQHLEALVLRLPGIERLLSTAAPPEIETQIIDLASGHAVRDLDPASFDQRKAALDPQQSIQLTPEQDLANIQRRARYAAVYLLKHSGALQLIILPINGSGYDSRLYGFLALEADANTVVALSFFEHEETPGLGAEIDSEAWRAKWSGRKLRDAEGRLRIGVAPGSVAAGSPEAAFQVDGIAGATVTSEAVGNLVRFWVGEHGFGPFLKLVQEGGGP